MNVVVVPILHVQWFVLTRLGVTIALVLPVIMVTDSNRELVVLRSTYLTKNPPPPFLKSVSESVSVI